MLGQKAIQSIENYRAKIEALSDYIWENPEKPYREYEAQKHSAELLKEAGFEVELGVGGVPTAMKATWGKGKPVIGFLGEYDALPGMSQKVSTQKEPVNPGEYGQGCGHNLLGVGHIAAVIGIKAEMEANNIPGTIVYFGCPAEELLTGKVYMARGGAFDNLDLAIAWHPMVFNEVTLGNSLGMNTVKFHFKGRTAHAGGDPHNGRSALDAVELTNVGANYLREHVTSDVRIHYIITNGGVAPNIVPDKATVWYYVRAPRRESVDEVYKRLVRVAEGAAHMTETQLEIEFMGGCYPTLNNKPLCELLLQTMQELPREPWTEEEIAFAKELNEASTTQWDAVKSKYGFTGDEHIHNGLMPLGTEGNFGSTDVGDVGYIVPTAFFTTACYNIGAPGHSWQITACSGHSIGRKGMVYAGKVMALAGLKVLTDPDILKAAQEEFKLKTGGKPYVCPIPAEVPVP